jgi:hypothetical protein
MSEIKERPILFSAPMVRAILEGRKTVTRRPVKGLKTDNPVVDAFDDSPLIGACWDIGGPVIRCPYGLPGDRLWVRESWWQAGDWQATYPEDDTGAWCGSKRVVYSADGTPPNEPNHDYPNGLRNGAYSAAEPNKIWRHRPSIHMFRWASRILLEITDVRVERLQAITYEDAVAEGVYRDTSRVWTATDEGGPCHKYPEPAFRDLWNSINGASAWDANPWVWVVEFKRVTP